ARRPDDPARPADRWPPPTSGLAHSSVSPSPWTAVYGPTERSSDEFLGDFHHGLLASQTDEEAWCSAFVNWLCPAGWSSRHGRCESAVLAQLENGAGRGQAVM